LDEFDPPRVAVGLTHRRMSLVREMLHRAAMRMSKREDSWREARSREGIAYGDYRLAEALVAAPMGAALLAPILALRPFVRERVDFDAATVPRDALAYMLHRESLLMIFTPQYWRLFDRDGAYLGYHGFASYVTSAYPFWRGSTALRYRRDDSKKPLSQVIDLLKTFPGRVALRTDAGGPYGQVRASLVDMAIATGRPLVAVRQTADRTLRVMQHQLPRPGSTVTTRISRPVAAAELAAMPRAAARDLLQRCMDALADEPGLE
jgi:hypothetical protein